MVLEYQPRNRFDPKFESSILILGLLLRGAIPSGERIVNNGTRVPAKEPFRSKI
jgi:hypothetical protein